ncbi:MAG TPA: hypothetical protein VGF34_15040 [Stellaceae bacterium]|jgi:hypothetical protein
MSTADAFVKLPRDLLASDAWRSLSINARRFLDFLMIEHMRRGGKANGRLLAPRRQLWDFGIGQHYVSSAIEEAEQHGLVICRRGFGRAPSTYMLTWLTLPDGSFPPIQRWKTYIAEINGKSPLVSAEGNSLPRVSEQHSLRYPKSTHKARKPLKSHNYASMNSARHSND